MQVSVQVLAKSDPIQAPFKELINQLRTVAVRSTLPNSVILN